jgi:hypothetical protein
VSKWDSPPCLTLGAGVIRDLTSYAPNMTITSSQNPWISAGSLPMSKLEEVPMNVSAISSAAPLQVLQNATATHTAAKPASVPTDTVSLSPAAQKAPQAGDVDHDGDSH